ncbi:MAG: UvrD-helicase domain-containing protein [Propionibacteriaceae bacterium]|jgi:exodeoxyribonuclease V beta subunit|nr:UvrD-helicase domain-containing protein [Propionibacteriaceae bacterium]
MTTPTPLPLAGQTLSIQASAGTGKTWTISALVCRFVAERDVALPQIAVTTFSAAAASEVKTRIASMLNHCRDALMSDHPTLDPELASLWTGEPKTRALRAERIGRALNQFDQATIMTTHRFCSRLLAWLGPLADHDPDDHVVSSVADLVAQTTADHYLRLRNDGPPGFSVDQANRWVTSALQHPSIRIEPSDSPRARFVQAVREDVERRARRRGEYTFDDILLRTREALTRSTTGAEARARVAAAYPVVLVDEFQDTDCVGWDIVNSTFIGSSAVVLIGDPKQSIYSFRGADLAANLRATPPGEHVALTTNHRSSPAVIDAVDALMGTVHLGPQSISATPVDAAYDSPRLVGAEGTPWSSPIRVRLPARIDPMSVNPARRMVEDDLVTDVTRLLGAGIAYQRSDHDSPRPLRPDDVAIIVTTNSRGNAILAALQRHRLAAVFTGTGSVLATSAARDWLMLLTALETGTSSRIRAAALTNLIGWDVRRLVSASADDFSDLAATMRRLTGVHAQYGPLGVFEWLSDHTDLTDRLAKDRDGDRLATDLVHVARLLHGPRPRLVSGTQWLAAKMRDVGQPDETTRRVPTVGDAIRILTVHQAKGLQFPIVYLPQLSDRHPSRPEIDDPQVITDEGGHRALSLSQRDVTTEQRKRLIRDDSAESLRACYVALTRATVQLTTWWTPTSQNTPASPLHRLLFRTSDDPPAQIPLSGHDPRALRIPGVRMETIDPAQKDLLPPGLTTQTATMAAAATPDPITSQRGNPPVRTLSRPIDQTWRRVSFSSLTVAAHTSASQPWLAEVDPPSLTDLDGAQAPGTRVDTRSARPGLELSSQELHHSTPAHATVPASTPVTPTPPSEIPTTPHGSTPPDQASSLDELDLDTVSPLADLPGGTAFGSLVHTIFEYADPANQDLTSDVAAAMSTHGLTGFTAEALAAALTPGWRTPLGPIADGLSLEEIPAADRLAELGFDLPLSHGDTAATLRDISDLIARHLPDADPLSDYRAALRSPELDTRALRGFLTGSIDAVLRIGQRHVIVDYKTNRLGPPGEPLTLRSYAPPRLAAAMMASHYPLQGLLYTVALHRFLRWRLADYDPERHLGGMAYLFVRGMAGPHTPTVDGVPCGVFTWKPPTDLVIELSDLVTGVR